MTTKELTADEIKLMVYVSIISADNEAFEEDLKQEIIKRYHEKPMDWEYIYEPLGDDGKKLLELYKEADKQNDRKS